MRYLALLASLTVTACTVLEQKAEDYQEVVDCMARPDKVVICWHRDNEVRRGFEARCCGKNCEMPKCPPAPSSP